MTTFFDLRDELSERLDNGYDDRVRSDATCLHVFRVLLMYGIYNKNSDQYGMVSRKACPVEFLMKECGLSKRTVYQSLTDLEEAGWITRIKRVGNPSDIVINWI